MAMLRKLFCGDKDALTVQEEQILSRLVTTHRRLMVEDGRVNTKHEAGFTACNSFLDDLATAATQMKLEKASRAYRADFTINYRALFPDDTRNYRVDVFEASAEQHSVIWVNGDKFEFSAEAMHKAEELQRAWTEVDDLLRRWAQACEGPSRSGLSRPGRAELHTVFYHLDAAWAGFEQKYITELIAIEEKARRLVVQAIKHEKSLQQLEASKESLQLQQLAEYREEQKRLVGCIAHLNSVANVRRKGRDDLGVEILTTAVTVLETCNLAKRDPDSADRFTAARILATDVVQSYEAMRSYLREVERCLEQVDPHLCNNEGLVTRLVDWEESWEVGTRYVRHEKLMAALCDLVAGIRAAQRLAPSLTLMCEECDVELFLVLPRIIWLHFLEKPKTHVDLVKSLLPHRFFEAKETMNKDPSRSAVPKTANRLLDSNEMSRTVATYTWDGELDGFIDKFEQVRQVLVAAQPNGVSPEKAQRAAREILLKRVVTGKGPTEDAYACLPPGARERPHAAVEDLMLELERWSIELQRHCPEDWNQCSAILVQCLTGGVQKPKGDTPFHV